MPDLSDAVRYADDMSRTQAELRRACTILGLLSEGNDEALRLRLREHLSRHDAERPVVCLNPGALPAPRTGAGPRLRRPHASEHAPVFTDELALVPDARDFAAMLSEQADVTRALAATFGDAHAALRYAPGKWSVRETIGHLADCERVLSYRLLRALRADDTVLPGFDHVGYVGAGDFESRTSADVVAEFGAVREATVSLIERAPAARFEFRLNVGSGSITGVALAYLIAGHELHHQALLRARYLPCLPDVTTP